MFNCAIIGYGKMGRIRKEAIEKNGGNVTVIYEIEHISCSYDNILKDKDISNIFIALPNFYNKEFTLKALKANKNVFCEKPPVLTYEDMLDIKVEENLHPKIKLMYGFNHRHHESVQLMKKYIDNKKYGDILWMRGRYGKAVDSDFFKSWRSDKKISGGGILIDQGIHMLDLFLYMIGDFTESKSYLSNNFWKLDGIEDNAFVMLKNKGITASLHSTMTQWRHIFSLEIFLSKGWMTLNGLKTSSNSYGDEVLDIATNDNISNGNPCESHTYNINNSWNNEVKYFFDCIKNNKDIEIGNSNDALKIMKLLNQIYKDKEF